MKPKLLFLALLGLLCALPAMADGDAPVDGGVFAIYNYATDGTYPITSSGLSASTSTTPQYFVLRANGTESGGGATLYNLQKAEGDGNYLYFTSVSAVSYSTTASNFIFVNSSTSGYTYSINSTYGNTSGPASPLYNMVGVNSSGAFYLFCNNKGNGSFQGYTSSYAGGTALSASNMINKAAGTESSTFNTQWTLTRQPYTVYDLVVTGLADNSAASVSYTNTGDAGITRSAQANGGFFAISSSVTPTASMFTSTDVDGYSYTVSISGTTVTVTYTASTFTATAPTSLSAGWYQIKWVDTNSDTNTDYTNSDVAGKFVTNYAQDVTVSSSPYALYLAAAPSTLSEHAATFIYYDNVTANGAYGTYGNLRSANGHYITQSGASSIDAPTAYNYVSYYSASSYPSNSIITSGSTGTDRVSLVPRGKDTTPYIGQTAAGKYPMCQFSPVTLTDLGLTAYTVSISGYTESTAASDNLQVTYTGSDGYGLSSVYNGGTFFLSSSATPTASDFTANSVSGYNCSVSISGTTITVTYSAVVGETVYTLSTPTRGSVFCKSGGSVLYGSASSSYGETFDATNTRFQFAFIESQYLGRKFLYNVGTGQFAYSATGASSTIPTSTSVNFATGQVTMLSATNETYAATYPDVIQVGDYQINLSTGGTGVYSWNNVSDDGNCLKIEDAGIADLSAAQSAVNAAEVSYLETLLAAAGQASNLTGTLTYPASSTTQYTNLLALKNSIAAGTNTATTAENWAIVQAYLAGVTVAQISNDKVYTILPYDNSRGTWYYKSDAATDGSGNTYMYSTGKAEISIDPTDTNQQYAIFTKGSNSYIFSIGAQKFLTLSSPYVALASIPTANSVVSIVSSSGNPSTDVYPYVFQLNSTIFGISNGQTYPLYTWSSTADGGNAVRIFEVGDIDATSNWNALDGIYAYEGQSQVSYTIAYSGLPNGTSGSVTIGGVARTTSLATYIPYGTSPFSRADIVPAAIDGYTSSVSVSGTTITVTYTSTSVVSASITYIYKYGDTEWYRETKTGAVGAAYPDLYPQPSGVIYSTIPSGTVSGDETVEIACTLRDSYWITPSSSYSSATWFYMTIHDTDPSYLYYNTTTTTKLSYNSSPSNTDAYKWAFLGNPFTGYKIINKSAGSTKILTCTDPTLDTDNSGGTVYPHMVTESNINTETNNIYWDFTDSNAGFFLSRKGESVYCNRRNSSLAFWTTNSDGGSRMYIVPVEAMSALTSLASVKDANGTGLSSSKQYRLVNRYTGKAIDATASVSTGSGNYWLKPATSASDDGQAWTVTYSSGFRLKNASTSEYLTGGHSGWWYYGGVTSTSTTAMYFYEADVEDGIQYYYLSPSSSVTLTSANGRTFLSDGGSYIYPYTSVMNNRSQWRLEEYTASTTTYASSITSGSYYRLVNYARGTNQALVTSSDGLCTTTKNEESYSQIWKITTSSGKYLLQNVLSNNYISTWDSNNRWQMGSSAKSLTGVYNSTNSTWEFYDASADTYYGLHSNQSHNLITWWYNDDNSQWLLEEVSLSSADLAAITALQSTTDYTSTLATFFSDKACTVLKSPYSGYTEAQLRSAMSALPSDIIDEAVCLLNNSWNSNATWSAYEKDFRIHSYECFSEPSVWGTKLGFGPFGRLTQPTGIKLSANDVAYILVDDDVADSDGHLYAELVDGVSITGTQIELSKGYNKVVAGTDCEIFITYNCDNTSKALSNYPAIKIHIAGGTCNGFFDMSRGHTNNDWYWLANNMFSDEYLHIRGNHTLFNCYLDRVQDAAALTEALSIWDWVFTTEETVMTSYFGGDYYRPVMTVYDGTSGDPNWSGNPGGSVGRVMIPGMYASGSFKYSDMVTGEGKWVISHEEGHGHQEPYNLVGTTEASNNSLGQIVEYLWGYRTSRGTAQEELMDMFNNGFSWVDMVRATNKYISTYMNDSQYNTGGWSNIGSKSIWLINKMWYQLWLYFHLKGDDGFFQRFIAQLVADGGIEKSTTKSSPASYLTDYMRLARAACKAANTDLYEFFKVWGFFNYGDAINTNKTIYTSIEDFTNYDGTLGDGIYCITDYSTYYIKMPLSTSTTDVNQLAAIKAEMQAYTNKAPGILFINDTGELLEIASDKECVKYDASLEGQTQVYYDTDADDGAGSTGHFSDYGTNAASSLDYTVSGTTVNVTGSGAVGFKVYDASGELVYVSMSKTFTVTSAIATGLSSGTYTLVASLGDDTDLILAAPGAATYTMTVYNGSSDPDSIQTYLTAGILASSKSGDLAKYATGDFVLPYDASNPDNAVATLSVANSSAPSALRNKTNVIYNGTAYNMVFTDKKDYYAPGTFTAQNVEYARSNTAGYNTVCLPFDFDAGQRTTLFGDDAKVFTLNALEESTITFNEVTSGTIAAGTPVLVQCPAGVTTWDIGLTSSTAMNGTASESGGTGAKLVGAYRKATLGEGYFKLNSAGTKFVRTTATSTITPFRFYLTATEGSGIRQFTVVFNEADGETTTAVGTLDTEGKLSVHRDIYDLQGRRITNPQRGQIYIIDGRKRMW